MVRAKRLLDDHAIFRKPSITGFQALLLYHQLQHTDTSQALSHEHWMGGTLSFSLQFGADEPVQMVHSALAEQMEILNLVWTSTMPMPQDPREVPLPAPQQRIRQRRVYSLLGSGIPLTIRRLYFGFVVGDAYYAAAAATRPRMYVEGSRWWERS